MLRWPMLADRPNSEGRGRPEHQASRSSSSDIEREQMEQLGTVSRVECEATLASGTLLEHVLLAR